jgi:RNA polymerase sigma-70 factor (ECF subfamily)
LVVTPSDAEVAARVRGGDIEAFAVLVDRHHARLVRYASHMLGNLADAEEVVQESFVRAFEALGRYDERDQFGAWITRILVNRCRSAVARRRDEEPLDEATLVWADGEDRAEAMAVREELAHALAQLPREQREALVLRYTEDRTFDEMAALTGAGVSALKMRVKRACERLRALLEESRARV